MASDRRELSLAHWYVAEEPEQFMSLTHIRLLIVKDGIINIMPGTVCRGEDNEQQLLFSRSGLCRITNGRRINMIVEPSRLRVGERAKQTGLVKPLFVPKGSPPKSGLSPGCDKDVVLIDRLHDAYSNCVELHEVAAPDAYIRSNNAMNLSMRLTGDAAKKIMDMDDYNPKLPMEDNFHNLVNHFAVEGADGYKLYPFDLVQGNGLVVLDTETFPPPLLVPTKALEECPGDLVRIRL